MKFNRFLTLSSMAVVVLGVSFAACGGSDEDDLFGDDGSEDGGEGSSSAMTVDPATAATVTGSIAFEGTPPAPVKVSMSGDPVCSAKEAAGTPEVTQEVVVDNGKLANVFVYVSGGLEGKTFDPPAEPATLSQEGCRYHPHVLGVMVNQPIKIVNGDPTLHNVHATPKVNQAFNLAQPNQGMENTKTFEKEEVMVPISCDVHGWMRTYVGVLPHPFFGVSGKDGAFSLKGLPPGDYTVTAWHEKLGKQDQKITVAAKETKNISFTFK